MCDQETSKTRRLKARYGAVKIQRQWVVTPGKRTNKQQTNLLIANDDDYRICSSNLRTFFSILAAEKSGCVKYADFFCGGLDLGFILVF